MKQEYAIQFPRFENAVGRILVVALILLIGGIVGAALMSSYRDKYPLATLEQARELSYGHAVKHCLEEFSPNECATLEVKSAKAVPYFPQDGDYFGTWQFQYEHAANGHTKMFDVGVGNDAVAKVYGVFVN